MKKFIARVNGKEYVVELEEVTGTPAVSAPVVTVAAPVAAPVVKEEVKQEVPAPKKTVSSGAAGSRSEEHTSELQSQ